MKGLKYISQFLNSKEQSLLLNSSLKLLSNVKHSNSISRRLQRQFIKLNPNHNNNNFMSNDAYYFQSNHFDNVIINFRELLSNPDDWQQDDESLNIILKKIFNLLPSHHQHNQQLHLLHLAENGKINPHIDNQQASGSIIIGISLGGERILKFKKSTTTTKTRQGPDEFQILLQPGSAYIQSEPLRSFYTHEIPDIALHEGRQVGGTQRLSIMLRDNPPSPFVDININQESKE